METLYLTRDGLTKLENELVGLEKVKRKEATEKLEEARKHGDLSENAEYDAAKEELAHIDYKINQLRQKLSNVQILNKENVGIDDVRILNKVTLKDLDKDLEFEYTLVSPEEMDVERGLISVKSPVGLALLGKKAGDIAEFTVPAGAKRWKVLKIEPPEM
ncbi:MAG: transcription elongation factor GreA [FCB group bacterium]|nr:transcription elongation factor GreA [FCB group bacterium]